MRDHGRPGGTIQYRQQCLYQKEVQYFPKHTLVHRYSQNRSTLRELVGKVNTTCAMESSGLGGFITYKLGNTIAGISKFKKVPAGYNTPLFLTVQVSPRQGRARPGDTDPRVNQAVQNGLLEMIPQITLKVNRAKIFVIVNAFKEVYKRMRIEGPQRWWDARNVINSIPENVRIIR